LMHEAFGLRATLLFDLAPGEYHANVRLAIASTAAGSANPPGHAAFAGNAIAASPATAWMSAGAASELSAASRAMLDNAGFSLHPVPLDAVEAAGGSLRCCVAEIY